MYSLTTNKKELEIFLKEKQWLSDQEHILSTEKPGEGNMNFTLRVNTGKRTFILKQSRDYVEKYPQVSAPEERVLREAEFYELTAAFPELKSMMPKITGLDRENHVLMMEDLGQSSDYNFLYKEGKVIAEEELEAIINFASTLHLQVNSESITKRISNMEMRQLNHEHIFQYPYMQENGLNLNDILPGLQEIATPFKGDENLKHELKKLGELYLKDGDTLLHGDYFPGSWLRTKEGTKIIDPEFCFFGFPEFEMGVTIAHLKLADQPQQITKNALSYYQNKELDRELVQKFASVEVLRRILGLAQLPLEIDLESRKQLLEEAREILVK